MILCLKFIKGDFYPWGGFPTTVPASPKGHKAVSATDQQGTVGREGFHSEAIKAWSLHGTGLLAFSAAYLP